MWYTRFEFQKRMAGYYLVGIASSGLSGLLAFGIEKMDGTAGLAGWRWIFILVCPVVGIVFNILTPSRKVLLVVQQHCWLTLF